MAQGRLGEGPASQLNRLRASAALTAFTNTIAVSLFALIPGQKLGVTAVVVGVVGVTYEIAALLSLARARALQLRQLREATFLVGLGVVFAIQLWQGLALLHRATDASAARTIAVLVVVCLLIGVARSWELVGGPSIGMLDELRELTRRRR